MNIEQSKETNNALSEILSMSPNWQVKKMSIEDLSENSKLALKSKYRRVKQALKEKFSESIAPGQAQSLADILSSDEDDEPLESDPDELLNVYKSSDKFGKMIALSFAVQKHSKTVVMEALNCLKRKVDEARKFQVFSEVIKTPDVSKHNRLKLDIKKCNHFLDFIFNNGLLQDVAYGTSVLKYTNEEKQVVPHAILVARFEHVITYYQNFVMNLFSCYLIALCTGS